MKNRDGDRETGKWKNGKAKEGKHRARPWFGLFVSGRRSSNVSCHSKWQRCTIAISSTGVVVVIHLQTRTGVALGVFGSGIYIPALRQTDSRLTARVKVMNPPHWADTFTTRLYLHIRIYTAERNRSSLAPAAEVTNYDPDDLFSRCHDPTCSVFKRCHQYGPVNPLWSQVPRTHDTSITSC